KAEKHEQKMIGEDEMRHRHENAGNAASAQIRQNGLCAFGKRQGWIIHVQTLHHAAGEKHQGHESNAVNGGPKMNLDERGEAPFATDQSRDDVIHRTEHDHAEKGVETEVTVSDTDLAELGVTGAGTQRTDHTENPKRRVGQ